MDNESVKLVLVEDSDKICINEADVEEDFSDPEDLPESKAFVKNIELNEVGIDDDLDESSSEDPPSKEDFSDPEDLQDIQPAFDCNELDLPVKKNSARRSVQFAVKVDVLEYQLTEEDDIDDSHTPSMDPSADEIDLLNGEVVEQEEVDVQETEADVAAQFELATHQLDSQLAAMDSDEILEEFKPVKLKEVEGHFFRESEIDIESQLQNVVLYDPPKSALGEFVQSLCCFRSEISEDVQEMRIKIFCTAKLALDFDNVMHKRVLYMVYKLVSSEKNAPPLIGSHWETIGFQGTDPRTDLRACGMLGLIQIISLFERNATLARQIFLLSKDEHQHFPFCVSSIMMSSIALKCLRTGRLDSQFQGGQDCIECFSKLHHLLFTAFYFKWKRGHLNIRNFDEVRTALQEESVSNPYKFMKKYESQFQTKPSNNNFINSSADFS